MCVPLCVLCAALLAASPLKAGMVAVGDSPCRTLSRPECYKISRRADEDFRCEWTSEEDTSGLSYTLHLRNETEPFTKDIPVSETQDCLLIGKEQGCLLRLGDVSADILLHVWVSALWDNSSCSSAVTSVQLDQAVKYPAPKLRMSSRSSGLLFLEWDKSEDKKGIDYEVRYKETGDPSSTWSCKNFTTEDDKPDSFSMSAAREAAYKLQARRRAQEVRYAAWSSWSSPIYMPIQLDKPPVVTWIVTLNKKQNARVLKVSWKPPPVEASVGGLHYNLSLYIWPCAKQPHSHSTISTEFSTTITLSVVRVNIYASNTLGSSPSQNITVPAAQHLRNCSKEMEMDKMTKKELKGICWEWYRLEDGKTQPEPTGVKNATKRTEAHITQIADMEDFVRYYYFAHLQTKSKRRPYTRYSCPVYKTESTPLVAPQNLTMVEVTSTSVTVCWQPIPVPLQRGFLTHYGLCLSEDCENVPESRTCKTFRDLKPASEYNITVAGKTSMGPGPSYMENIWTSLEDGTGQTGTQSEWIIIGSLLGLSVLIACPLILIRLRNKLPAIPKPVIQLSAKYSPSSQEVHPPKEEVYVVTLEHMRKTTETLRFTPEEEEEEEEGRTLLREEQVVSESEEEEEEEEEANEEKQDDVMNVTNECDVTLNPDYKRQTLGIPVVTETMERTLGENKRDVTSPVYKNGLFFDLNLRVM